MTLLVTRHEGITALLALSEVIDEVNAHAHRPSPFLSSAFLLTLARHSEYDGGPMRPMILTCSDADAGVIRGFAAFTWREDRIFAGVSAPRLDLLTSSDADRPTLVAAAGFEDSVATAIVRYLVDNVDKWQMVEWRNQEPGSPLHRAAHEFKKRTLRVRDISLVPYTEVSLVRSEVGGVGSVGDVSTDAIPRWDSVGGYFSALSKRMRSNVSRQTRNLYAAGEVELLLSDTADGVSALFDAYLELEQRSWKGHAEAGIERHGERVAFMRRVVAGEAGLTPSFIGVVLNGVLIAALVNGHFGDRTWCQEMAFDESYAHLGPGQLLLLLTMGDAIARRQRSVNFFQLHGYFKKRWLADEIAVVNVQLLRRPGWFDAKGLMGDAFRAIKSKQKTVVASWQARGEGGSEANSLPGDEHSDAGFNPLKRASSNRVDLGMRANSKKSEPLLSQARVVAGNDLRTYDWREATALIPFAFVEQTKRR